MQGGKSSIPLVDTPEYILHQIKPGMRIFLGTGVAEPRTFVKHLISSNNGNIQDLELIQLISFNEALSLKRLKGQKFRLKTFFAGWVVEEAIAAGQVDLIPSRFNRLPGHFASGRISVDMAVLQISPPDTSGQCTLGVAVDVGRIVMDQAALVVGEINPHIPRTYGETFVHINDFDYFIDSDEPPYYLNPWPPDPTFDKIATHIAGIIEDRSCLAFSLGPLFDALGRKLASKCHLGIHSPFFTDALMDLVVGGSVTNRYKPHFKNKCLTSYAIGTPRLMQWLDRNPQVEFQTVDKVFDPREVGGNPRFGFVHSARKIDLTGRVVLNAGKGNIVAGPAEIIDFITGAEISEGGYTIFGIPSRNLNKEPNIRVSVERFVNLLNQREGVDMVATEYGVARLRGRSLRERAQALIEIAHPDDRPELVRKAKRKNILYEDQIFLVNSTKLYPQEISISHSFKDNLEVHFRPIKPSDEEEMRRLFYRFSDEAVYARYFSSIRTMPHTRMQQYVNVDWTREMSIVGLVDESDSGRIVAEGRYICELSRPWAEVAFVVDQAFQRKGISTFLYQLLIQIASERGIQGFTAEVLFSNIGMMKVFHKGGLPVHAHLANGVYSVIIPFNLSSPPTKPVVMT